MKHPVRILALASLLSLAPGTLAAQTVALATPRAAADTAASTPTPTTEQRAEVAPLVTDRPDFTESAEVVERGLVQVESGYTFDRSGSERSHSLGEVLLRVGIGARTEVRVGISSFGVTSSPEGRVSGMRDGSLGLKVSLLEGGETGSWRPATALLVGTSVPTGARAFRTIEPQPEAKLALGWSVLPRVAFSSNLNYASPVDLAGRFNELSASASVGLDLAERVGAYTEVYGFAPSGGREGSRFFNGGVTYRFTPVFQLDVRAGVGLSPTEPASFFGVGLSRRW